MSEGAKKGDGLVVQCSEYYVLDALLFIMAETRCFASLQGMFFVFGYLLS